MARADTFESERDTALRQLREQKTGEQHRISMAVSRATEEKDKTIKRLQGTLKTSQDILNVIADILYKASEVFRRAIDAIIRFATEKYKSIFSNDEAADIKSVMQSYGETTEQQKAVGAWLCDYAEHLQPFEESNIATHSMRLAMLRKVGMIGRLREDKVAHYYDNSI